MGFKKLRNKSGLAIRFFILLNFFMSPNDTLSFNPFVYSFLSTISSIGGLDVGTQGNTADLDGYCSGYGCSRFSSLVGTKTACSASVRCDSCRMTETVGDYCQNIPPPNPEALVLASGYYYSMGTLKGSMFESKREMSRLGIIWAGAGEPIDISRCLLDDLTPGAIQSILYSRRDGTATVLHVRLVFVVTVARMPSSGIAPSVELIIKYNPPQEDRSPTGRYIGGGRCPKTSFSVPLARGKESLVAGQIINVIQSITVPWDSEATVSDANFEARLKCIGSVNCNLANYRFCFRIYCQLMTTKQAVELTTLQEKKFSADKLPPIPEELASVSITRPRRERRSPSQSMAPEATFVRPMAPIIQSAPIQSAPLLPMSPLNPVHFSHPLPSKAQLDSNTPGGSAVLPQSVSSGYAMKHHHTYINIAIILSLAYFTLC